MAKLESFGKSKISSKPSIGFRKLIQQNRFVKSFLVILLLIVVVAPVASKQFTFLTEQHAQTTPQCSGACLTSNYGDSSIVPISGTCVYPGASGEQGTCYDLATPTPTTAITPSPTTAPTGAPGTPGYDCSGKPVTDMGIGSFTNGGSTNGTLIHPATDGLSYDTLAGGPYEAWAYWNFPATTGSVRYVIMKLDYSNFPGTTTTFNNYDQNSGAKVGFFQNGLSSWYGIKYNPKYNVWFADQNRGTGGSVGGSGTTNLSFSGKVAYLAFNARCNTTASFDVYLGADPTNLQLVSNVGLDTTIAGWPLLTFDFYNGGSTVPNSAVIEGIHFYSYLPANFGYTGP